MKKKLILLLSLIASVAQAQTVAETVPYDPHLHKIIPDKVFEIGIPVVLIIVLINALVAILKNRAEHQLKMKMIERDISEEALVNIFRESNAFRVLQPLKWFVFGTALALAFFIIHFIRDYLVAQSGYLALGIILLCVSIAFLIYYRILSSKV